MSVEAKLLEAQQSVEAVVKQGFNDHQKYKYATAEDVIAVGRKALHEHGLLAVVHRTTRSDSRPVTTDKGKAAIYAEVEIELKILDPESGTFLLVDGLGAGHDNPGDKAVLKARTAAKKYAWLDALALPVAEHDPEKDVEGDPARLPAQQVEDPAKALSDEKITEVAKAYKAARIDFDRFCLVFGSVGAEAPKIARKDSIRKAVASMTDPQAESMLASLEGMAADASK